MLAIYYGFKFSWFITKTLITWAFGWFPLPTFRVNWVVVL